MTGLPAGFGIELYLGGSWVDVTAWHVGEDRTRLRAGRASEHEDAKSQQLDLQLRNDDGRFTPRSPSSPYYPHVTRGVPIRLTVTVDHVEGLLRTGLLLRQDGLQRAVYAVWTGTVTSWDPQWPGPGLRGGTVRVTARDGLGELEGVTLEDRWTEEVRAVARASSGWCDIPVLAASSGDTGLDNAGVTVAAGTLGVCSVEAASAGSVSWSAPDGLDLARSASWTRESGVSPPVLVRPQGQPGGIDFWLRVPDTTTTLYQNALTLRSASATLLTLQLVPSGGSTLALSVLAGALTQITPGVQDSAWRHVSLRPAAGLPTSTTIRVDPLSGSGQQVTVPVDMRTAVEVWAGAGPAGAGGAVCTVAGLTVTGSSAALPAAWALNGQTMLCSEAFGALQRWVPSVGPWSLQGADDRAVGAPSWSGKSAADALHQLARSVAGVAWSRPDGATELVLPDLASPSSPVVVLDVEEDLDGSTPPTMRDASAEQPTRAVVRWASGTVTVVDAVAESSRGERVQVSLDTCAVDASTAQVLGQMAIAASDGLRVTSLTVDACSTVADRWAVLLGLRPTDLLRVVGWPVAMLGASSVDVRAEGWELELSESGWRYTFDCSPVVLRPGVWGGAGGDPDQWGRWDLPGGAGTGGTAMGGTGVGSLVLTSVGGPALSTAAGDYPLFLSWGSEVVRVDGPPASGVSPQTVLVAARGQQGTAAVAHVAGEPVGIWQSGSWGF